MASTIYNKNNMSTSDVKKMQQALIDRGYDLGSYGADGIWGAKTEAALSQFKKDTGGSNTYGTTVGNETFNKLYGTTTSGGSSNKGGSTGGTSTGSSGINWGTAPQTGATVPTTGVAVPGTNFTAAPTLEGIEYAKQAESAYQNYLSNMSGVEDAYGSYITQLQGGAGNANAALDEARANALAGIKSTYDDSARNYYRLYRTQEKELPEQLSSIGATGGATESAALRLMNNYSDNLYKNETARNQDTNALNENYYNAIAQNSQKLAAQLADAYLQLGMAQTEMTNSYNQNQQNMYNQYQQNYASQLAAQEAAAQQASIDKWNTNVTNRIAQQLQKGDTLWTWTGDDGKMHWSTYESVGLANGGKELSTGKKKVGSSGGSNPSGNPKPINDPIIPDASQTTYDYVYRNALANMYGNSTYGMKTDGQPDAAKYIISQHENGTISEKQAEQMLNKLGISTK